MTPQAILLKAAKLIHQGRSEFSCNAIERCHPDGWVLSTWYADVVSPVGRRPILIRDIIKAVHNMSTSIQARDFRVLLLLMIRAAYNDLVD